MVYASWGSKEVRSEAEPSYLPHFCLDPCKGKLPNWLESTYPIPGSRYVGGYMGVGLCKGRDGESGWKTEITRGGERTFPFLSRQVTI